MEKRGESRSPARDSYENIVSRNCSKKAQFYLIAAIIIVMLIISLSTLKNYAITKKEPAKFYDLCTELNEEGARVVDYGIYNARSIPELVENFTDNYFINYSKEKDKDVELVFVYGNEKKANATVYKRANTGSVTLSHGAKNFTAGANSMIVKGSLGEFSGGDANVTLLGKKYHFEIKEGENFFFIIAKNATEETHVAESGC